MSDAVKAVERALKDLIRSDPDRAERLIQSQLARLALKKRLEEKRLIAEMEAQIGPIRDAGVKEHAQPAPQAPLTPLTEAKLWELRAQAKSDERTADQHWFVLFARAIEAAHGIRAAGVKEPT